MDSFCNSNCCYNFCDIDAETLINISLYAVMIMKLLLIKTDGRQAFLADTQQKKFHCQYGVIDLSKAGKKITGRKTKSSLGYEFLVLEPAITDMLRKAK